MAFSSLRRWPTVETPRSFRSSAVRLGRTVSSISLSRNAASYFLRPRLRSQTTTSIGAPLSRVAAHHDPCLGWMHPDIQLHASFIVSLHHGLEEERSMTVDEKRRGSQRRSGKDRRRGLDARSEEEKRRIGERRSGIDRRSGSDRRSSPLDPPPKRSS